MIWQEWFRDQFLSTPSARRATQLRDGLYHHFYHFYPRPPRGGRLVSKSWFSAHCAISIHALREEGDGLPIARNTTLSYFYPRPPRGGRLYLNVVCCRLLAFLSTPSARRATCGNRKRSRNKPISIHALREEGDSKRLERRLRASKFLSTPSARRATSPSVCRCSKSRYFYPRPPRGGRRA